MTRQWLASTLYVSTVTLVVAGLTHVTAVLLAPYHVTGGAYARVLAAVGSSATTYGPALADLAPFEDPAMARAVCPYDLQHGPVTVSLDVADADLAILSVHGRYGRVLYGLTNRSATRNRLAITILTAEQATQHNVPPDSVDFQVIVADPQGFVMAQSLAPMPSAMKGAEATVGGLVCRPAA